MEIRKKLTDIFRKVFSDEKLILTDEMTANDVEDWDSLTHIDLITEIENSFDIRFTLNEAVGFSNVGEILKCIVEKTKNKK